MTVGELIEKLQKYDPSMTVVLYDNDYGTHFDAQMVDTRIITALGHEPSYSFEFERANTKEVVVID